MSKTCPCLSGEKIAKKFSAEICIVGRIRKTSYNKSGNCFRQTFSLVLSFGDKTKNFQSLERHQLSCTKTHLGRQVSLRCSWLMVRLILGLDFAVVQ